MRSKIADNKVKKRNRELYRRLMVSKAPTPAPPLVDSTSYKRHNHYGSTGESLSGDSSSFSDTSNGKHMGSSSDSSVSDDNNNDDDKPGGDERQLVAAVDYARGRRRAKLNAQIANIYDTYGNEKRNEFRESVAGIVRHCADYNKSFNTYECDKLSEMFKAINFIREPPLPESPRVSDMVNFKVAMVYKLEKEIRNFISVAQNVAEFECLCENDRIALVKYGSVEIICMRLIQFYNTEAQSWTIKMGTDNWILSKVDMFKHEAMKVIFGNCFKKISDEWDSDPYILDLMTIILLFDPNRPNLLHREVVK
ncbi:unnamed protein product [Medioppia subpectinata]|uniref:NR LBD domain-containing protein n=1 Tax=Medioppia subpectinata TaxID=1979941 RepID=A0A7R9LDU0_9ACAR|nr:unnamed protein product [Medioppia subpectinata]CAG2117904.1 unnamed protein product [Medioppia subpectinata]